MVPSPRTSQAIASLTNHDRLVCGGTMGPGLRRGGDWMSGAGISSRFRGNDERRGACCLQSLCRVQLLPWILDHRDRRDLDIGKLTVLLLDAPDVDFLDDVARLRIDHYRAARAVRVLPVGQERHR